MGRVVSWVVIAALVAGGALWWTAGAQAAGGVELRASGATCERTRVEARDHVVVVRAMRCTYRLVVRNSSDRRVRIGGIDPGGLGRDGDGLVVLDEDRSASEFGVRVEPGEQEAREIVVVFRDGGSSERGALEIDDVSVRGSLWVRPFTVEIAEPLRFRVPPRLAS